MTIEELTAFLGWASVINMAFLLISTCLLITMRKWVVRIHSALFDIEQKDLGKAYFQYLAQYKIAIIVLNLTPYLALKIIG